MKLLREILDREDKGLAATIEKEDKLLYHYSKFNDDHKAALRKYTDYDGRQINNYLWEKHKGNHALAQSIKHGYGLHDHHISGIDEALKVHKTPHDLYTYSATRHDPRKFLNKDRIVHHPAYLSTSISQEVAKDFTRYSKSEHDHNFHFLHIHVPKGSHGSYVSRKNGTGKYVSEHEFVLPRNTKLKYLGTSSQPSKYDKCYTDNVHHMRVVK